MNSLGKILEFNNKDFQLIYCNGVNANIDNEEGKANLLEQKKVISEAFGNRNVTVFNNPTSLEEYLCQNQSHEQRVEKEQKLANEFANFLKMQVEQLPKTSSRKILVFAHSHGAWITKLALESLKPQEREHLDVYTFGGVAMIPKTLASVVENYVFKGDMIARSGNKRYDSEGILKRMLKITARAFVDEKGLENALYTQFLEEWYAELDQSSNTSNPEDSKASKEQENTFFSNFWSGNPEAIKGFEERFNKYLACITHYKINILSNPMEMCDNLKKDVDFFQFMKKKTASYGSEIDNNCHKITAFKKVICDIAQKNNSIKVTPHAFEYDIWRERQLGYFDEDHDQNTSF